MYIDLNRLNNALDRTLEAAVNPLLWPEILSGIAEATGAFGVNIVPAAGRAPGSLIMTESLQPALEAYFDGGWDKNEWRNRAIPILTRRGTALEQHYSTQDDFKNQEYYRAQSRFGLGRTCIILFGTEDDQKCFVLHRKIADDPYGADQEAVFRMMRDRLMVSSSLMKHLSARKVEGMMDAFQIANIGAIFFDRLGKITEVNAKAHQCMGSHLQITRGELFLATHRETARVRNRMKAALSEQWLEPDPTNQIVIERAGMKPLLMRIQRLGGALPDVFSHAVGVCVLEDLNPHPPAVPVIAQSFGLTPMEATLSMMLAQGMSLREVAAMRSISYETTRTHLRAIFSKLGVRRQSELVALIGRMNASRNLEA